MYITSRTTWMKTSLYNMNVILVIRCSNSLKGRKRKLSYDVHFNPAEKIQQEISNDRCPVSLNYIYNKVKSDALLNK
jgi:hypothetical protein